VDGIDDDIEIKPYMRMCTSQKRMALHKIQHYYFWFLYTLLHLMWVFYNDYRKYFTGKIGEFPIKKMSIKQHISFWAAKAGYLFMFAIVPIMRVGFERWVVGFLIASMITGFVLSIVFQLAHTVEETSFPGVNEKSNHIENEWAIHQVNTTADFATRSKLVSWLVGGLNFQVEHHLFPKISHIHYPAINKIIRETCAAYGLVYLENKTVASAIVSHVNHLREMGRK
jgi:linoleoyl-CoA desaturase